MSLLGVIKINLDRFDGDSIGIIVSVVYRRYEVSLDDYLWVADVDLETAPGNPNDAGKQTLIAVPIDDPSREVYAADIGTQVKLRRRPEDSRYVISGLAKIAPGTLSICLVDITPCGSVLNSVGNPVTFGSTFRLLDYSELGTPADNTGFKYGELPYGTSGKFDASDTLIKIIIPA